MTLSCCRECARKVSAQAWTCPGCGAPRPAQADFNGTGIEWTSETHFLGLPLVHVAFGRDRRGRLRVAKGWLAIGQFAIGILTIAQFGVGILGVGQMMFGAFVAGQFAAGSLVGVGQFSTGLGFCAGQVAIGGSPIGMVKVLVAGIPAALAASGLFLLNLEIIRRALGRPRMVQLPS